MNIHFNNQSGKNLNELYLHLPPRSQQWKKSFLNKQLIGFQHVKAHFADSMETGWIKVDSITINGKIYQACHKCEFVKLSLENPLLENQSIDIGLSFQISLSPVSYQGVGYDENTYQIIDWLPRMAPLDSSGFKLYPLTFYRDFYQNFDRFKIDFTVPAKLIVASNTTLNSKHELELIEAYKAAPLRKKQERKGLKTLSFSHIGTNLQFIISKDFYLFPITDSTTLYSLKKSHHLALMTRYSLEVIKQFFINQLSKNPITNYDIVVLNEKKADYQSDRMLTVQYPKNIIELSRNLAHAKAEMLFRYRVNPDGIKYVWLARGIPYYYKYRFMEEQFPGERWLPFSNSFIGRLFALDQFNYSYQSQFLFQFLARQGLDQQMSTPADSLTRLNYKTITQAKTFLSLNHLRKYIGEHNFKRALHDFFFQNQNRHPQPNHLKRNISYYFFKNLDWFFKDWVHSNGKYDYRLVSTDYCPTIATATVRNTGDLKIPYSLTGIKDGQTVLTKWYKGHNGKKSVQMYHEKYDKVTLNYHQSIPEYNQKDNTIRTKGLFKKVEPVHLQLYGTLNNPNRTQIFWIPAPSYNAYDKLLLGITFYNRIAIQKPLEYVIGPNYSTGTGKVTGYGSFQINFIPTKSSLFRRISARMSTNYYHHDEGLSYLRLSPIISFYLRKPYPQSPLIQIVKLRLVSINRELQSTFEGPTNSFNNAGYLIFNARYQLENTNILKPYTLTANFQLENNFSKLDATIDLRWMFSNKKWLIWRNFFGVFLKNTFYAKDITPNYYSYGLSGTLDYLFDYNFIGRSDSSGIWSQQMFINDGGFKSQTGIFADNWMMTSSVSLPIWAFFGLFLDIGFVDRFDQIYMNCGARTSFLTDFLEIYFPVASNRQNFINEANYAQNIRFILNLNLVAIVQRLRRGYY